MMEEMCADNPKVSINGSSRASKECPALCCVLRYIWVGVVQEGDHDDEVVDHTPWHDVGPEYQFEAFGVNDTENRDH